MIIRTSKGGLQFKLIINFFLLDQKKSVSKFDYTVGFHTKLGPTMFTGIMMVYVRMIDDRQWLVGDFGNSQRVRVRFVFGNHITQRMRFFL